MSGIKTVLRDIGGIFLIVGFATLVVLLVPFYFGDTVGAYNEYKAVLPMLITSFVFLSLGLIFYYGLKKAEPTNFKTAMVTAALGWFFISLIGSIPFWLIPYNGISPMDPLSGFFESMSGWTGTGLTMVENEELLPYTLQFWRSFIQWIGGIGVIVLTLSILARPGTGSFVLYKGEARDQKMHPSIVSTVRTIWWVFLLYTIIGIVALTLIGFATSDGMDPWQSLNHAMTSLATGGFSVTNDSISSFGVISQIAVIVLMGIGAIAFAAHYDLLKGRIKKFLSDAQFKAMIIIIIIGVIVLTYINLNEAVADGNLLYSLKISAFQFTSAITCTGFASVNDIGSWTDPALLIIACAMIIGGAAGSTAGGIKIFRGILLYKGVSWRIKRAISTPRRVFVHKFGNKSLSKDDATDLINEAAIISFMWVILLFVGVIIIMQVTGEALSQSFFEVCSAQGNVGLSTGITNINMDSMAKTMLIFNMWIGRLEIIPIIVLIKSMFGFKTNIL
jgi:trk system potassium uptake protein